MSSRPVALALATLALLSTTAGCTALTGDDGNGGESEFTFTSNRVWVSDRALDATDYEAVAGGESVSWTATVTVGGDRQRVRLLRSVGRYVRRPLEGGAASDPENRPEAFTVYGSPVVKLEGERTSLVRNASDAALVARANLSSYGNVTLGERAGSRRVPVLGREPLVERYNGTATVNGERVRVSVHVTRVFVEGALLRPGDWVVAVAVHPKGVDARSRVDELLQGVQRSSGMEG